MEEQPPQYQGPSHPPPSGRSRSASARGYSARQNSVRSERGRPQSAISRTSSRRSTRSASWKEAIKSASLKRSDSRKERAAALGEIVCLLGKKLISIITGFLHFFPRCSVSSLFSKTTELISWEVGMVLPYREDYNFFSCMLI